MLTVVLLAGLIGLSVCDVSSGPYPYSPSPASAALPGEYGAPPLPNSQYGAPASPSSVQLSQENIQFGGQIVEVNNGRPSSVYLSPSSSSQFQQLKKPKPKQNNAAFLPKPDSPKPFRAQLNAGEVFVIPRQSAQFRNPIFVESQSVFSSQKQLPKFQQIRQFNSAAPQFQRQQVNTVYGPPAATQGPYPYPPSPPVHETSDERTAEKPIGTDDAESEETTDPTVIAVSNASGQYYILGKDNTLQRVVYEAIQTEDDAVNNGFTAQLRYSPVEPIRDPVYGYDDEGHLVRIFNKK